MLVEIAFWQSIGDLVDVHIGQKGERTNLRKVRDNLLEEKLLARLAGAVGERS